MSFLEQITYIQLLNLLKRLTVKAEAVFYPRLRVGEAPSVRPWPGLHIPGKSAAENLVDVMLVRLAKTAKTIVIRVLS